MSVFLEWSTEVGPFACNCRVIACPKTARAVVIDPGDEAPKLTKWIGGLKTPDGRPLEVVGLLHTHGHLDHIGATRGLKEALGPKAEIRLHAGDDPLYRALNEQGRLFGMEYDEPLPVDRFLEDGESFKVGELKFEVAHTPGHSPGSVCLRLHEDSGLAVPESLYTGDTLFKGSVGRTDLWGANQDQMFENIQKRILSCDDDTRVCPGHGPNSTIGRERKENPFLV